MLLVGLSERRLDAGERGWTRIQPPPASVIASDLREAVPIAPGKQGLLRVSSQRTEQSERPADIIALAGGAYDLGWWVVGGGGGASAGDGYALGGTLGQAAAGALGGGGYTLTGGWWGWLVEAGWELFLPIVLRSGF